MLPRLVPPHAFSLLLFRRLTTTATTTTRPILSASPFNLWFQKPTSDVDLIFSALSADPDGAPPPSSLLSSLRLRLDEPLVLRVLRHRPRSQADPLLLKIRFFDWAGRHPPFRHTRATFLALFSLLSRSRHVSLVLDWLRSLSSARLLPTPSPIRFHETLVLGYSVAGRPLTALQILARMRFLGLDLDAFAYHVLLNSLVEDGSFHFADSLQKQIVLRGLANSFTMFIQVKSLCRQRKLDLAWEVLIKEIHGTMPNATAVDRAVARLAEALCGRKRFREARQLVEEFGGPASRSVWLRNLIAGYQIDAAIDFLRREDGYVPEVFDYNRLVYRLLRGNRLEEVYDVVMEMRERGITPDHATMSAVLCFFCKGGMVDLALQLYNSRNEFGLNPNNLAINHLINALCGDGNLNEAFLVLEQAMKQGYFPGKQTFRILADHLCRHGKLDEMGKLLDEAVNRHMVPINFACARYISALCEAGRTEEGYMVAKQKSMPLSRYTYEGLIQGFIALGRGDMICRMLMEMQDHGHVPSQKLYRGCIVCLCKVGNFDIVFQLLQMQLSRKELDLKRCYNYFIDGFGHAKQPEHAKQVFMMMQEAGIEPDWNSRVLILQSYMKSKRAADAKKFFDEMHLGKEPSKRMYNILIVGLCRASKPEAALLFWDQIRKKGIIPSLHCYEELIKVLCSTRDYITTVKIIKDFEKTGRPLSVFICNMLLLHSIKTKSLKKAWFDYKDDKLDNKSEDIRTAGVVRPKLTLLGKLIVAFSGGIRPGKHKDNLDEVVERYIPVNLYTYNTLLRGLATAGDMDSAHNLFNKICKKGYTPNEWTYDIMIRGLFGVGKKEDAEVWMEKMYQNGFCPMETTMNLFYRTLRS